MEGIIHTEKWMSGMSKVSTWGRERDFNMQNFLIRNETQNFRFPHILCLILLLKKCDQLCGSKKKEESLQAGGGKNVKLQRKHFLW